MSKVTTNIPDYHVGKEYSSKGMTLASICAMILYTGAGFVLVMMGILFTRSFASDVPNLTGALVTVIVLLALAIGFTALHRSRPQRKFTVLNTYLNEEGDFVAQVRYLDGTEDTLRV
jgi:hypothetical protein